MKLILNRISEIIHVILEQLKVERFNVNLIGNFVWFIVSVSKEFAFKRSNEWHSLGERLKYLQDMSYASIKKGRRCS